MLTCTDNQTRAVKKLKEFRVGALFMEPGEGKTLPAYLLVESTDADFVLYLAPFQSVHSDNGVMKEIEKYGGFTASAEFVGIESLSNSDRIYLELIRKLETADRAFVICDESLKIKNWGAKRTKRIIHLGSLAKYRLILNGTPVARNLLDMWAQMEFLSPKILKMGIAEFKNTFCEYTVMTKRVAGHTVRREWINKYHNIDYLYSLISPFVFEAKLSVMLNEQIISVPYSIGSVESEEYNRIKGKYLDNELMEAMNNNIFIEMTAKMQHSYSITDEKFQVVDQILKKNDPSRVIIFCKFVDSQEECRKRYPGIPVLSYQKHSFSLNLQNYDTIIEFDQTWDFGAKEQSRYRIKRRGQNSDTVRYFRLIGNTGLEKIMQDNIDRKVSMSEYFKKVSINKLKQEL